MKYSLSFWRFVIWYLSISFGLPILSALLFRLTGFDLSSAVFLIAPIMLVSMSEGNRFVTAEERLPESSEAWKFSFQMAGVAIVLEALKFLLFLVAFQGDTGILSLLSLVLALGYALLIWLVGRSFFSLGARNQYKSLRR